MTDNAQALLVTSPGGPEVLRVAAIEVAAPEPGELQVEVAASGVNFIDVYMRQGVYPTPTPFVLGREGAGTVLAIGAGVVGFQPGDRVAWPQADGSHASRVNVRAADVVLVPDAVPLDLAAAAMLQGMTAHYLVHSTYPVQAGDVVVVHAPAGGVGQLLVQLVKQHGGFVVGVTSTEAKAEIARSAGADAIIDSHLAGDPGAFADAVRAASDSPGAHVVYDGVGRSTFDASLASLRRRGLLAVFGGASGQVPPFDVQRLNAGGSLFVTRPTLADYMATPEELQWRGGDILNAIADGSLRLQIGGRYPLDQAAQAYDDLESRRSVGKLLLRP